MEGQKVLQYTSPMVHLFYLKTKWPLKIKYILTAHLVHLTFAYCIFTLPLKSGRGWIFTYSWYFLKCYSIVIHLRGFPNDPLNKADVADVQVEHGAS